MQLLDALPADNFYKVNGSADSKQYMGKFKGKETGKCQMYVTLDVTPILEIKTPEYTIFINSREGGMAGELVSGIETIAVSEVSSER